MKRSILSDQKVRTDHQTIQPIPFLARALQSTVESGGARRSTTVSSQPEKPPAV